jgi:hypothetical protein
MKTLRAAGIALAFAVGALASTSALAAQNYDWTFTDASSTLIASGTLTTGAADNSGFDVTALSGNVIVPVDGVSGKITNFTPGSGDDGVFIWDNIVYPTAMPHIDNPGLLFDVGSIEFNIYNGAGAFPAGDIIANATDNFGGSQGTFNLTAVPEPASWAMMLVGFGGLGVAMRSRRKMATATA